MTDAFTEIVRKLEKASCSYSVIEHDPVYTMEDVERLTCIPREYRVKTLVVTMRSEDFSLCGVGERSRLDIGAVARELECARKDIALANPEMIESLTTVMRGAIGLILPQIQKRILLSDRFQGCERIYCGVGRSDRTLSLAVRDLVRISNVHFCKIEKSEVRP